MSSDAVDQIEQIEPPTDTKNELESAILRVTSRAGYIQKKKQSGLSYPIVMEEQVMNLLQPELLREGLTVSPEPGIKLAAAETYTTAKGSVMNRVIILVDYRISHAPSGLSKVVGSIGEGDDIGSKGIAKAMTSALKYMYFQTFCIARGNDPDKEASDDSERANPNQNQNRNNNQNRNQNNRNTNQNNRPQQQPSNNQPANNKPVTDPKIEIFNKAVKAIDEANDVALVDKYVSACETRQLTPEQMVHIRQTAAKRKEKLKPSQPTTADDKPLDI